jgi:DNA-directed RNA polymerase subunit beta
LSSRDILQTFYKSEAIRYDSQSDTFYKKVSELLMQQQSREDVIDPESGEVIIRAGRKISRSALRRLLTSTVDEISCAEESLVGQVVADDIIDPTTGEVLFELIMSSRSMMWLA